MKLLILTADLPYPAASGGAIRTYGILKGLAEAGHQITLMSVLDRDIIPIETPLAEYCEQVITMPSSPRSKVERLRDMLLTSQADISKRLYNPLFEKRLLNLLDQEDFDLIQFEGIEIACYLPSVREKYPKATIVFDTFNAEAELQRVIYEIERKNLMRLPIAVYSWIQSRRIHQYEGKLCRLSDAIIAVSEEDADFLQQYDDVKEVAIVPSGITSRDYQPIELIIDLGEHSLVFTGKMDYRPNIDAMEWFSQDILPNIQQKISDIHLTIVGQKPHPRVEALTQDKPISITGWVDSVLPYLQACSVYVVPLRMGSGTRLKILEAMAMGCAIVTTSVGASGLSDEVKNTLSIADTEEDFANAVTDLLQNPQQRQQMGEHAKLAVQQHYDWSVLIPRLLAVYKGLGLG